MPDAPDDGAGSLPAEAKVQSSGMDDFALARDGDFDRYIAALRAPREVHGDLMTLIAFRAEIARIPVTVTEPMMGLIRLQWWRDAFAMPADGRTGNPLADRVRDLMLRRSLPVGLFISIADGFSDMLEAGVASDEQATVASVTKTDAVVAQLMGRVINGPVRVLETGQLDQVVVPAGQSYGLSTSLLRAARLPEDEFGKELFDSLASRAIALHGDAKAALAKLDRAQRNVVMPCVLASVLTKRYLADAQTLRAEGSTPRPISPLAKIWSMWVADLRKAL